MEKSTTLGIDPGTKYMGIAVIHGSRLLSAGVHTLSNGSRPYDLVGQARRIVLSYVEEFSPAMIGIEKPLLLATKRAALVSVIAQELRERSREIGMRVLEIPVSEARLMVARDPHARKLEVARALVEMGFQELRHKLPKDPPHPVFGFKARDRYWLHLFDALAVAVSAAARCR